LFTAQNKKLTLMKKLTKGILIFTFCFASILVFAQNDCKVLKPGIDENYTGKCKKGLAHGKGSASGVDQYDGHFKKGLPDGEGTYKWATGETYIGDWNDGYRQGEGVFIFTLDGKESLLDGIWAKDEFIGKKLPKPRVLQMDNVNRYSIRNAGGILNRVLVDLKQNGSRNVSVENYSIVSSGGTETSQGLSRGFENISFPVNIMVRYTTWNELKTYKYNAVFEVEIFEPGDWRLELTN